jgi:hypothetical protein
MAYLSIKYATRQINYVVARQYNTYEITGKQLKEQFTNRFVKLTTYNMRHNDYDVKPGINIDPNPWFPYFNCFPGKIYFIRECDIVQWITYNDKCCAYLQYVEIDDDTMVYVEEYGTSIKFGAHKLTLSTTYDLREYIKSSDELTKKMFDIHGEETCYYLYKQKDVIHSVSDRNMFQMTINKHFDLCYNCLKSRMINITDVPIIHRNACVLKLIDDDVYQFYWYDVINYFEQLIDPNECVYWRFVDSINVDDDILLKFRKIHSITVNKLWTLMNDDIINLKTCNQLLNNVKPHEEFVKYTTEPHKLLSIIINQLVKKSYQVLSIVPNWYSFHHISQNVIKKNWRAIQFVSEPSDLECYYAISQSYEALKLIKDPALEFCEFAIRQDWRAIKLIDETKRAASMWTLAIMQSDEALDYLIYS